ncbi:glycosyltransferase family 2 protein [bacterium]|nr:glycosyltransferase family 2 protein [bacterium]MBU1652896.1 glycosyltransferase family 2 protein [bacterium]MBU1881009.1 glycosyltransferase family 2 protein [bacterium]
MTSQKGKKQISVIIPVYNDAEVLPELHRRLRAVLDDLAVQSEIIFIDDGSTDKSVSVLLSLQISDPAIQVIELTRNFGQPNAISAGLGEARGDLIILMDSDLQDRPEDIPLLITAMERDKTQMAIARWSDRRDGGLKVWASQLFNKIANKITSIQVVPRTRVFRAMQREIVDELLKSAEKTATPLSLLCWMGFDYSVVDLVRDERFAGSSGYTFVKMLKLSLDRIFSYSLFPIRIASILGIILGFVSLFLAIYFTVQKLFLMKVVPGWTSIVVIMLFLLGMNFIFMGIIGEYLGRIYIETKDRPNYVIRKIYRGDHDD